MSDLKTFVMVLAVTISLPGLAQAAEDSTKSPEASAAPATCQEAVVNPVTGYAFCLNPRGAAVDPPPRESLNRPCKTRAHHDDAFTMYEHWSGCNE